MFWKGKTFSFGRRCFVRAITVTWVWLLSSVVVQGSRALWSGLEFGLLGFAQPQWLSLNLHVLLRVVGLVWKRGQARLMREIWVNRSGTIHTKRYPQGPLRGRSILPDSFTLSRRFGIFQNGKLRCIDDFSMSSVNAAVQTVESPKPHTSHVLAALIVAILTDASVRGSDSWVGRGFDLKGAYRQCAVHPESRRFSHIFVTEPSTHEIFAFRMRALPFGAVRSVHGFLRAAVSLWTIIVKEFLVLTTNYFDDYICLATQSESAMVTSCVHLVFKMLGWKFAESGQKACGFAQLFSALGICVNVSGLHEGSALFDNTESRRSEIVKCIDEIWASGKLSSKDALRLRGRLQFASGQVFGRVAKAALTAVTQHAYSGRGELLDDELVFALNLHRRFLTANEPRVLRGACAESWFIFTDACFELEDGLMSSGIGAVLCDPSGNVVSFFSVKLSQDLLRAMNPCNKKTIVYECEFFAVFCALRVWSRRVKNAVVIFTDNNAVRDALIACKTKSSIARTILVACLVLEQCCQLSPWIARVPTDSNVADDPSRFVTEYLLSLGATAEPLDSDDCWKEAQALFEKWGGCQASCSPRWKRCTAAFVPSS